MASSLRKRLGRRTAIPDLKTGDEDSGSSSESLLKSAAPEVVKDSNAEQRSIAADDLSTTPPPPNRKLRSSRDFSRDKTPPQSLLEKYKSKSAKDAVPTLSTTVSNKSPADATSLSSSRKDSHGDTHAQKDSGDGIEASSKTGGTRKVHGVEFDMLRQSKASTETLRHGPTKGERETPQPSGFQHRRTRSTARREQRERARASSDEDVLLGDELKGPQLDTGLEPPEVPRALSIRKVERTPSPGKDDEGEWVDVKETEGRPGSDDSNTRPRPPANKTPHDASSSSRREATLNAALANLIPFPPPSGPGAPPSPLTYSPSTPTPKKSILKNASSSPDTSNLTIPVAPPIAPAAGSTLPKGYLWCSDKSTTSRPLEPWTWCKRWTCCSCGPPPPGGMGNDELALLPAGRSVLGLSSSAGGGPGAEEEDKKFNGRGEVKAATTMAEQRVCCRLSCGHVRCGACCLVQEAKYVLTSGPFTR